MPRPSAWFKCLHGVAPTGRLANQDRKEGVEAIQRGCVGGWGWTGENQQTGSVERAKRDALSRRWGQRELTGIAVDTTGQEG